MLLPWMTDCLHVLALERKMSYFTSINSYSFNPYTPKSDLIDLTLSDVRRFYSSKGDPLG